MNYKCNVQESSEVKRKNDLDKKLRSDQDDEEEKDKLNK